jgi:hypothetical protein
MANGRCYLHGGKSLPPGPSHPRYIHGRLSKALPANLRDKLEEAVADPSLVSLREDVAFADVRRNELASRVESGESGKAWEELGKALRAFDAANSLAKQAAESENPVLLASAREEAASAFQRMRSLITAGKKNESSWDEAIEMTERLAALKAAEMSRLRTLYQMMTLEDVLLMIGQLHNIVAEVVTDREQLTEIGRRIQRLVNHPGNAPQQPVPQMMPLENNPTAGELSDSNTIEGEARDASG